MSAGRHIQLLFISAASLYWLESLIHYYVVLMDYAGRGMHLTNTGLYVAVENWLTVCAVMFTACAYLLVAIATRGARAGGAAGGGNKG